ncbi:nicotinate-nucleotide adenylyltransferase [Dokdonia ponticola]|uniref:Nicotinate-nucleotide adenylyltransferase n=1 Tax=Dokdonia ponticola TaxID=2041041 RepID=A0ABV9I027_9FLAO
MKNLIIGLFIFGLTTQVFSQVIELPEVFISPVNYKYLYTVNSEDNDPKVAGLERKVAQFDVTKEDYYDDDYDGYTVSFYIPSGSVVAAYDKDGKLLRTIERFKNVKLPTAVQNAIAKRFPNWSMTKDSYQVSYNDDNSTAKKIYKVKLTNGEKSMKVKTDEAGNFL